MSLDFLKTAESVLDLYLHEPGFTATKPSIHLVSYSYVLGNVKVLFAVTTETDLRLMEAVYAPGQDFWTLGTYLKTQTVKIPDDPSKPIEIFVT